jgi:hypothetical protein
MALKMANDQWMMYDGFSDKGAHSGKWFEIEKNFLKLTFVGDHHYQLFSILQNIVEYTFGGAKELKVVFFNVIGLIQSTTLKWMTFVWWRSSMNRAIHGAIFCLHIRRNRCTT